MSYINNQLLEDVENPSIMDAYIDIERYRKSSKYSRDRKYWIKKYNNQRHYSFPAGYRSEIGTCDEIPYKIEGDTYNNLVNLANEVGCSMQSLMLSMIAMGVYVITGKDNFCLQTLTHGRQKASQLKTIGAIQNLFPVFYDLNPSETAISIIKKAYSEYLEALSHSRFPYYDQIPLSYKESFKHGLNFVHGWLQFSSMEYGELTDDENFKLTASKSRAQPFQFYVAMLETKQSHILFELTYQTKKYTKDQCNSFINTCVKVMKKVLENPEITIGELKA